MSLTPRAMLGTAVLALTFFQLAAAAEPAAATHYTLDPAKSALEFQFVQAGAQNKGHFGKFPVSLELLSDSPAGGKLDVLVQMTSLDTGDKERDDTLRGPDLFDVAKFPQARFTSTQISKSAAGYEAVGKLTIRGVTREQRVAFTFRTAQEQGRTVGYLTGKTTLKRLEFGVGQGDWKSTEWVGGDVVVSYSLRLVSAAR
ncbi:MAG TPA: YceI family protein [Steroidobacteraceae bacterium]|jgi:polyisoprenoid-binding protein YceI